LHVKKAARIYTISGRNDLPNLYIWSRVSQSFQSYNNQLQELTRSILEMGDLVQQMIAAAHESLTAKTDTLKEQVRELDRQVNALDRSVSEQATLMLALRSPMGDDLRFVTSALRIASDLERAGDLAKNTTKRSMKLGDYSPTKVLDSLNRMVDIVRSMVGDALTAIETRNPEQALSVWKRDKQVDDLYHEILRGLQDEMQRDPQAVESATHFVFAAKNFERIADYATSLARTVHYVTTGTPPGKDVLKAAKSEETN
jgi:phosphate transport system protein